MRAASFGLAMASLVLGSSVAGAVTVSIGGVADATAGLVSGRSGITNRENFEAASGCPYVQARNGAQGEFRIGSDTIANVRLNPTGDTSCYASIGLGVGSFAAPGGVSNISYLGLYWGSVDDYNGIQLIGADFNPLTFTAGNFTGTTLTGDVLRSVFGITGGTTSVYVNFDLDPSEAVIQYNILSIPNTAFEFDNVATIARPVANANTPNFAFLSRLAPNVVPEPMTTALLGLGLIALAVGRRRAA